MSRKRRAFQNGELSPIIKEGKPLSRLFTMTKTLFRLSAVLLLLSGCASPYDVNIEAPDQSLDTTNAIVPVLAAALPKNLTANTFNLVWKIVPDKTKPREAILHWILYDRSAKTLAFHRDAPRYETYSGVTDAIIQGVAARGDILHGLVKAGCTKTLVAENGGDSAR